MRLLLCEDSHVLTSNYESRRDEHFQIRDRRNPQLLFQNVPWINSGVDKNYPTNEKDELTSIESFPNLNMHTKF